MTSLVATHYAFADFPSTPTAELALTIERSFMATVADGGSGSVVGFTLDADLAAVDTGDIITFDIVDDAEVVTRAFAMIATDIDEIAVDPDGPASQQITLDGPGHLAVYKRGVIGPPGGPGRSPVVMDVVFDYTHPDYDEATGTWVFANDIMPVLDAMAIADGGNGLWPLPWSADMPHGASIIGPTAGTSTTAPVGTWYYRDTFTTSFAGVHLLYFTADNAATLSIDGKPIASVGSQGDITTSGFGSSFPTTVSLSAGTHVVAGEVTNYPPFGGPNPSGLAAQLYIPGFPPTLVWGASGGTQIVNYPAETPGMTPGTVLRLITEEHAGRDWADNITFGFDDELDSDGEPWPTFAQIAAKVGEDDCYALILKIMAVYADVEMDPNGWTLNAWIWGTRNPASGVTFDASNLTSLAYKRQYQVAEELLILWSGGWSANGSGNVQAFLSLGPENTPEEIGRVGDQVRAFAGDVREQVTLTYEDSVLPWSNANFVPGAIVTVPTRGGGTMTERAMQIACSYSKEGERVLTTLVVKDVVLQTQERFLNALKGAGG